jgi:hypothetical protein
MAKRWVRASALVMGLSAVALVAGCSAQRAPTSAPLPKVTVDGVLLPEACSLLAVDEAEEAMGLDPELGLGVTRLVVAPVSQCTWSPPDGTAYPQVVVRVAVSPFTFADQRAAGEATYPTVDDVSVPGASDAFVTTKGKHLGMDVGPNWVLVTLVRDSDEHLTKEVTELAGLVAGRMEAS